MVYRKRKWSNPKIYTNAGSAFIKCGGIAFYLGRWNGEGQTPLDVMQQYVRYCEELKKQFLSGEPIHKPGKREDCNEVKIRVAVAKYLQYLQTGGAGYLRPDGTLSEEFSRVKLALTPLAVLYGDKWAHEFTVVDLENLRTATYTGSWRRVLQPPSPDHKSEADDRKGNRKKRTRLRRKQAQKPLHLSWGYTNRLMRHVVNFFSRCEVLRQIPAGRAAHLKAMENLMEDRE